MKISHHQHIDKKGSRQVSALVTEELRLKVIVKLVWFGAEYDPHTRQLHCRSTSLAKCSIDSMHLKNRGSRFSFIIKRRAWLEYRFLADENVEYIFKSAVPLPRHHSQLNAHLQAQDWRRKFNRYEGLVHIQTSKYHTKLFKIIFRNVKLIAWIKARGEYFGIWNCLYFTRKKCQIGSRKRCMIFGILFLRNQTVLHF